MPTGPGAADDAAGVAALLETARALGDRGICVYPGDYYAYGYFTATGLRETGGAVRASIYHYNTAAEVDRLLAVLDEGEAGSRRG